jgi:hypothetical protein
MQELRYAQDGKTQMDQEIYHSKQERCYRMKLVQGIHLEAETVSVYHLKYANHLCASVFECLVEGILLLIRSFDLVCKRST